MKKIISLFFLVIALTMAVSVSADEEKTFEIGASYTETIVSHQHIPYQMETQKSMRFFSANNDELTTTLSDAILNAEPSVEITCFIGKSYTPDQIQSAIMDRIYSILADNPFVFYMDSLSIGTNSDTGYANVTFDYSHTKQEILQFNEQTVQYVNTICDKIITDDMTDLQKEIAIHDYLIKNCSYDAENYNAGTVPAISHSAYGALVLNVAVCDGYSRAFEIFMDKLGIPCINITSDTMNHAWNIVNINGKNYHVDVTWDDLNIKYLSGNYEYFNIDDTAILAKPGRSWETADYPACTSTDYSYIYNLVCTTYPQTDLEYFYFSDKDNDSLLTKMDVHSGEQSVLSNNRSYFIVLYGNSIFYSNYSKSAYLYSIRTDGSDNAEIISSSTAYYYIENDALHYTLDPQGEKLAREIPLYVPTVPTLYAEEDIRLNQVYFADTKDIPTSSIYNYNTLNANVDIDNVSSAPITINIITATYSGSDFSSFTGTSVTIPVGGNIHQTIPISLTNADTAKIFILKNFSPLTAEVKISK